MKLFDKIEPVFNVDDEIINLIKQIDKNLNSIEMNDAKKEKNLIKKSKVRSIHSSLSIETNSLSLFDVENILENKLVVGKKDEVQEVKNAIEAYNHINEYNYKSEKDFLIVHQIFMKYFNDDGEGYRNHGEAVKKKNEIVYVAPESLLVPSLMKSLFEFINSSKINLIIKGAIFHYYFVAIHPFSDGNGRMARFWGSLMLINYNQKFEYIPIEEEIYLNQEKYYNSIEQCHVNSNANVFIKFMLKTINESLEKIIKNNSFALNEVQKKIIEFITNDSSITQNKIAELLDLNVRTIKRNFKILIDNNIIERVGSDKTGLWKIL